MLAALLALAVTPARATNNHEYAKGEYAIISDGLAPNKRLSLASHGEGEFGSDNFHVWLMAEPAHRKIAALDDISSNNNLDTGPAAYHARWSADSRHVAVSFRSDRHALQLNLYQIENRRAHLVSGPSLFRDVTSRDVDRHVNLRTSTSEITWTGPDRFRLREHRLFQTSDAGFMRRLGRFGKIGDRLDDGGFFAEFSAEADCVLISGNRYRIVDLRVGKFGE